MAVNRVLRAGLLSLVLIPSAALAQSPIQPQNEVAPAASPDTPAPAAPSGGSAADAADVNPLANRPQVAAALRFLQSQGVKLTTLGTEGGLAGYLGESPNGRVQTFYVTPDGNHVVAGLMFDTQGANTTGVQIGEMMHRFEAAQKQLSSTTSPMGAPTNATAPTAPAASPASAPAAAGNTTPQPAPASPPQKSASLSEVLSKTSQTPAIPDATAPAATPAVAQQKTTAASPSTTPAVAAVSSASADKYVSALDRGAVERALREVPWFQVGVKEAPALYVVVDPQCPFCHAAWKRLQPYVYNKKLQLRIVMIAGLKGSLPLAISILSRQNPGEAWLAGEGSVDNFAIQAAPQPDTQQYQSAQKYLDMNAGFVRTFGISSTPTFMYFGKDERLYSSIGLPEDADGFMSALK